MSVALGLSTATSPPSSATSTGSTAAARRGAVSAQLLAAAVTPHPTDRLDGQGRVRGRRGWPHCRLSTQTWRCAPSNPDLCRQLGCPGRDACRSAQLRGGVHTLAPPAAGKRSTALAQGAGGAVFVLLGQGLVAAWSGVQPRCDPMVRCLHA